MVTYDDVLKTLHYDKENPLKVKEEDGKKIEVYEDLSGVNNSLLIFSDTPIASYSNEETNVEINYVVRGDVKIYFDGECFRYPDDFPDELVDMIQNGTYGEDERVDVDMNNWINFEVYSDGEFLYDDVIDIEGMSAEDILKDIEDFSLEVEKEVKENYENERG